MCQSLLTLAALQAAADHNDPFNAVLVEDFAAAWPDGMTVTADNVARHATQFEFFTMQAFADWLAVL